MKLILFFTLTMPIITFSQPNCNLFSDPLCKEACEMSIVAAQYQGSEYSQMAFDKATKLCPNFDYAYREKSVPYLKRGDFIIWKKLIDKAVEINPINNLGYRGWCKYQFLRDYKGALEDLIKFDYLMKGNVGYSQNGDYHLKIVIGLCYKALGDKKKAIEIITEQMNEEKYSPLNYDYLHLGVLFYEIGDYKKAIKYLKKEIEYSNYFSETYYYLALAYKKESRLDLYRQNLILAEEFYNKGYFMRDVYTCQLDKIFLYDIKNELKNSED